MAFDAGILKYFKASLIGAIVGGVAIFSWGYFKSGSISLAFKVFFITAILGILEISLSFDNAVVNATILKKMSPLWQKRFLLWGMFIAVFGMRLLFPLILVSFTSGMNPVEAAVLAVSDPKQYSRLMLSSHTLVAAFGGSFLMLTSLKYFFERKKHVYWIRALEKPLSKLGRIETSKIIFTLIIVYFFSQRQIPAERESFLVAGIWGTILFCVVDGISAFLHKPDSRNVHKLSVGYFVYLEVLDASFSFDGVIGAFAITHDIFVIMTGLGVGALFVRSLTLMLVKKEIMNQFVFLEHGAFYALAVLSMIMFFGTIQHVPEVITGTAGLFLICLSIYSSLRYNRIHNPKHTREV